MMDIYSRIGMAVFGGGGGEALGRRFTSAVTPDSAPRTPRLGKRNSVFSKFVSGAS